VTSRVRHVLFWLLLLAIENVLLIVLLFGGLWLLSAVTPKRKSAFEEAMERLGHTTDDLRARAPYVMFRPRATRVGSYPLGASDVKDFRAFCRKLHREGNANTASPSRRVW